MSVWGAAYQYIAGHTERKERTRLITAQADSETTHGKQIALEMALNLAAGVRADHERLRQECEGLRAEKEHLQDELDALEPRLEKLALLEGLEGKPAGRMLEQPND